MVVLYTRLALLGFCLDFASAQITTCPTTETSYVTNGSIYKICAGSDYAGMTSNAIPDITSTTACADRCDQSTGCKNSVYNYQARMCYIKGGQLQWVSKVGADSVRFDQKVITVTQPPPAQGPLLSCPTTETTQTTTNGVTYKTCANTDFEGETSRAVGNIPNPAACASLCESVTICSKAVYNRVASVCHLKNGNVNLVASNQADTVQLIRGISGTPSSSTTTSAPAGPGTSAPGTTLSGVAGAGLKACPAGESQQTFNGVLVGICPSTDYQGNTLKVVGVANIAGCAQSCASDATCSKAVFDSLGLGCHFKGADSTLNWVVSASNRYSVVYVGRGATSSPPPLTSSNAANPPASSGPAPLPSSTTVPPTSPAPPGKGRWSGIIQMPIIPVAGYIVPQYPESSRMLVFSSWGAYDFSGGTGITQFADYNLRTGAVSQRQVTETKHDMFCPGISSLEDGQIIITGGSNAEATSLYNGNTNSFSRAGDLKIARGYQTSATLSNGKVFTIGGSFSGSNLPKNGEIFDPATNTWTLLPQADVNPMRTSSTNFANNDDHGWLFGWRDGSVFQAGPSREMHWYGTAGTGSVSSAGVRDPVTDSMCGVWVMYDAGKIFSAGGAPEYDSKPAHNRAHLISIDQVGQPAKVEQLPNMINSRGFANAVVLPDGTVIITGGQAVPIPFNDDRSVFVAELFDPVTKTFRELAAAAVPRNYHSMSLLLADGTVFVGGGGLCPTAFGASDAHCNRAIDHPNGEIFTPPYLFRADGTPATRPVISSMSSDSAANGFSVRAGGTLNVQMNDGTGVTFALVRIGSATHSVNSDQRRISMTNVVANGNQFTIRLPSDSGVLIPGPYFLFALSKDKVPSMARTVRVTR